MSWLGCGARNPRTGWVCTYHPSGAEAHRTPADGNDWYDWTDEDE